MPPKKSQSDRRSAAVGYLRRSTEQQERSLPDQKSAIDRYAAEHNLHVLRYYINDAITGNLHVLRYYINDAITGTCSDPMAARSATSMSISPAPAPTIRSERLRSGMLAKRARTSHR